MCQPPFVASTGVRETMKRGHSRFASARTAPPLLATSAPLDAPDREPPAPSRAQIVAFAIGPHFPPPGPIPGIGFTPIAMDVFCPGNNATAEAYLSPNGGSSCATYCAGFATSRAFVYAYQNTPGYNAGTCMCKTVRGLLACN